MAVDPIYTKSCKVTDNDLGSCDVYHMRAGSYEKPHYHNGIEIVYVLKGKCKTHQEGKTYTYQAKEVHEVINDSSDELVFVCLTIPPESEKNTFYI